MKGRHLPRRALNYWRIRLLISCALPALIGGFFYYTEAKVFTIFTFLWVAVFLFLCFIYCPMYYRCYRYSVNGKMVKICRGAFYQQTDAVYIRNLQYTTLSQTPIQRMMNLATLCLHAAGGVVWMRCIDYEEARLLRVQLARKMEEDYEKFNHD